MLEKVEVVVPSKLKAPLRACDVPGFGPSEDDPFRQSIVDDQLKKPVSTLCLVLPTVGGRMKDTFPFERLDKLGLCAPLHATVDPH